MELDSDSSEDDFPVVTLKPAWRGQSQNEQRGSTTISRQTDEIVLSSDSENGHTMLLPKADNATIGPSVPLPRVRIPQTAGTTVAEPAICHATLTTDTVSISPPQLEQRETAREMKRRQVGQLASSVHQEC